MRAGDTALAEKLKAEVSEIKAFLSGAEAEERGSTRSSRTRWRCIPNMPLDDVPVGKDEHDNVAEAQGRQDARRARTG